MTNYNATATINGVTVPLVMEGVAPSGSGGFTCNIALGGLSIPFVASPAAPVVAPPTPPVPEGPAPVITAVTLWPTQVLVAFEPPLPVTGKTIVSYTVTGVNATWLTATSPASPIMTQGGQSTGGNTYTVHANYSDGTTSPESAPSVRAAPLTVGVASKSPYVYWNGVFYWGGDYSYGSGLMESYADQSGAPTNGADFMVSYTNSGGWQPFAPTNAFDLTPYQYLTFQWKPTVANDPLVLRCETVGDNVVGNATTIQDATYAADGKSPTPGVWGSYKVPLSVMGIGAPAGIPTLYKLCFTNPNGTFARTEYFQQIAFE